MSFEQLAKRLVDLVGGTAGLMLAAPLMGVLAVGVRVDMGAPVFYGQVRPGLGGVPFRLWKFRTMTEVRGADGQLLPDGERLTKLGRFMRRFSLDELPQLYNVTIGTMSLVGPRPLLVRYLPRYTERQRRRLRVKPGITGWAQVRGRNSLDWAERLDLDVWYVENWSLALDLRILAETLLQVLRAEGAKPGAGAEFDEFWGDAGPPAVGPRAFPVEQDERVPA